MFFARAFSLPRHVPCGLLALSSILWLTADPALGQLQFHKTELKLQEPVVNISDVDRVIFLWSTALAGGEVQEFDLEDLVMELHSPGGLVYADPIIVNGVVQPFAGLSRSIGDVFWRFDSTAGILEQVVNTTDVMIEMTTGLHYNVYDSISIPDDNRVSIKAYVDGINQDPHTDQLDVQSTLPLLFFSDFEDGDPSEWSVAIP